MEVHRPKFLKGLLEEIFVIVISISLAVIAERIVESWLHNKEAKESMVRLNGELIKDTMDLRFNYPLHADAIIAEQKLTDWSKGKIELTNDSLAIFASNSLPYSIFYANTSEFESLKSSSKLEFIGNEELVSKLINNYNRYTEYKTYSGNEFVIQQELSKIYRNSTSFEANSVFKWPFVLFDGNSVRNLRGKKEFENILQEKKEMDQIMLLTIDECRNRILELLTLLKVDKK
jgi:hypothetical protein